MGKMIAHGHLAAGENISNLLFIYLFIYLFYVHQAPLELGYTLKGKDKRENHFVFHTYRTFQSKFKYNI